MDDEPASEAIDGDLDPSEEGPDSMDILMGEIDIPYETNYCYEVSGESKLSPKSGQSPCHDWRNCESEMKAKTNNTNSVVEPTPVNINSLKKCQGYTCSNLLNDQSPTVYGFIRTGEAKRTTQGKDPIFVPNEVMIIRLVLKY